MKATILATIFAVLTPNVLGNSCIQGRNVDYSGFETTYRYCEPPPSDIGRCKCHNIHINGTGKGDCSSLWNGTPWCYVIGEDSGCKDKTKSAKNEEFGKVVPYSRDPYSPIKDIYFSEDACAGDYDLPWKVGLEDFLPGYELLGTDPPKEFGGGGFYAPTPEACEAECYTRSNDHCNAWTFIPGESGECYLKLYRVCENTLKARRQNPKAISGFLCYTHPVGPDTRDYTQCWSTTGNSKPDFCPYYAFQAHGSELENLSGTVS